MMQKPIGINVRNILILFSFLPIYCGSAYMEWTGFSTMLMYMEYAVGFASFFILIVINKRIKISSISVLFITMYVYIIMISIKENADVVTVVKQAAIVIYSCILFDINNNKQEYIYIALQILLGSLIFCNIILMIIFPNGLATRIVPEGVSIIHFMGHDNSHILYLIPCFAVSEIRIIKNKKRSVVAVGRILQGFVLINILITQVGTTIVWISSLLLVYFVLHFKAIRAAFSSFVLIAIPAVIDVLLVVLGTQIKWIVYIAQVILNRSATFTGRIYAWRNSLDIISEKMLFGHGFFGNDTMPQLIQYQQAHNLLLQLLVIGGIVLVVCFYYIVVKIINKSYKSNGKLDIFCRALMFSYLVYTIGESQFNYKMLIMLLIVWHSLDRIGERSELPQKSLS